MLTPHGAAQSLKGRAVTGRIFSLENDIGHLDVKTGLLFYKSLVDPYLSYAAEISPDASNSVLGPLVTTQHTYLRRLLGVNMFAPTSLLFSETGIWPLLFRRLDLCLRYLQFLLRLPHDRPAYQALCASIALWQTKPRRRGWFRDLLAMCTKANLPISLNAASLTVDNVEAVRLSVRGAMQAHVRVSAGLLSKISTIKRFVDPESRRAVRNGTEHDFTPRLRAYLSLPNHAHRIAFTRLLFSAHPLAIDELRYAIRSHPRLPRALRLCRFCLAYVEDEAHALFGCMGDRALRLLRRDYFLLMQRVVPSILQNPLRREPSWLLTASLNSVELLPHTAAYTHAVLKRFLQVPLYVATPFVMHSV
ncbi:hypothetical protein SISSUDRAFT_1045581 [Sistotremastrum suecicum HHB10207 ss-3]|uniref:Reverse transcriptase zinc-binding domain-containing protein n=1 Tax=Sistotremastrum suecicum HHB10207 ss-3 TaxID=1314776 RepID=A0A166EBT6_9AGAM|nr:hypothetical protein SISSUDRAFT_1045581 [Sistotremastrum suecicum HHB10207 ss-3]